MRLMLAYLICIPLLAITGCENGPADQQVAASELYSLTYDFHLWDLQQEQGIDNDALKSHVADSIVRHLLILRAAKYEIADLRGTSLETLCRATTNEARQIVQEYGNEKLGPIALSYIDEIRPEVLDEVRQSQMNMLDGGCLLTPRSK